MTTPTSSKNTNAFFAQAAIAFGLALTTMIVGVINLPVDSWVRAFLGLGTLFLTSSCFTLAKCVRDAQETGNVISRLDQARLERMLAEFDPYGVPHLAKAFANAGVEQQQPYPQVPSDPYLTIPDPQPAR